MLYLTDMKDGRIYQFRLFRKSCWFLEGHGWFPRESPPPDCYCRGEGRGEVEGLPAYTNQVPPARPSLWMPLPLPASPYKGEETEWRPHKSLKSQASYGVSVTSAANGWSRDASRLYCPY